MNFVSSTFLCSLLTVGCLWGDQSNDSMSEELLAGFLSTKKKQVEEPSKIEKKASDCGDGPRHNWVNVRYTSPKGIGYNTGYTTLAGFFAPTHFYNDAWVPFLDLRGHVFDNGKLASNVGVGVRYLSSSRIWGGNLYYDFRNTKRKNYNQISLGLESLGDVWDYRINGYLPVSTNKSSYYDAQFDSFSGHSMLIRRKRQFAMGGFNGEVGVHFDQIKKAPIYVAGGPYYLIGSDQATWGGKLRARVDLFDDWVSIEANTGYDHFFKWTGQGQFSINIPFGPKAKVMAKGNRSCNTLMALNKRAIQPVDREEIIPVGKKSITSTAIDPSTGEPFFFLFVDNTSHSAGTYESPYNTLANAESNSSSRDIIYIFPGDGTTTGLDAGVTLKDYQKLWGTGIAHSLDTTAGSILIPAQSGGTFNGLVYSPTITNMGTVVTLGNGNEVSGLFLQNGAMADAISVSNKTNATVSNCTIAGANAQGGIGVSATELAGTLAINNCILNQNTAIALSNSTTNLQANITNSSFSGGDDSTTSSILWSLSDAAQGVLTANNNTFDSSYIAITVSPSNTSTIAATINNNSIGAGGYGIYINGSDTAAENININGNTINTYYQSVIISDGGVLSAILSNNTMNSTEDYCIEIDTSAGEASILLADNLVVSSDDYALYLNHSGGTLSATLNGNSLYSTEGEYAIYSNITGSAVDHVINLNGNALAGEYGWYLFQTAGNVSSTWNNNTLTPYEYGIYASQESGTLSLTFNNNTVISSSDDAAIYWQTSGSATDTNISIAGNQMFAEYSVEGEQGVGNLTLSVTDNILTGYTPVYLNLSTPGTTTATISDNTCSGYYGIEIIQSAGTFNSTVTNNTVASSGTAGYYYGITAGSTTQVISGNAIRSGAYGSNAVYLNSSTTGSTSFTVADNILAGGGSSSAGASVLCTMEGGTQLLALSNNSMTNSGGFSLSASNACTATWNVNGNEFFASGSAPVSATASVSGTSVCMQLNNNTAYPTTGAYSVTRTSPATFTLNPPQGNIGQLTIGAGVTEAVCP